MACHFFATLRYFLATHPTSKKKQTSSASNISNFIFVQQLEFLESQTTLNIEYFSFDF
jgi:hypothetical protein